MKHKIGFIGLGLIGGSIAKAIRQYYHDYEIVAFDKIPCTCNPGIYDRCCRNYH